MPETTSKKYKEDSAKKHKYEAHLRALAILMYTHLLQEADDGSDVVKTNRQKISLAIFGGKERRITLDKVVEILESWGMKSVSARQLPNCGRGGGSAYDISELKNKVNKLNEDGAAIPIGQIYEGIFNLPMPLNRMEDQGAYSEKFLKNLTNLRAFSILLYIKLAQNSSFCPGGSTIAKISREQMSEALFVDQGRRVKLDEVLRVLEFWGLKILEKRFDSSSPEEAYKRYEYDISGILEKTKHTQNLDVSYPIDFIEGLPRRPEDLSKLFAYIKQHDMLKNMSAEAWLVYRTVCRDLDYRTFCGSRSDEEAMGHILRGDSFFSS